MINLNIKSHKYLLLTGIILCGAAVICHAETYYKTGFEAQNEPFGNSGFSYSHVKGGVSTESSCHGKFSMSPGPGTGKNGKFANKTFSPPVKNSDVWIEYQFRTEDTDSKRYMSFLYVYGEEREKIATLIFKPNKIVVNNSKDIVRNLDDKWHQIKLHLKYESQKFDLYIDDGKFPDIPFRCAQKNVISTALERIAFGGSASLNKPTFYDDIYVGNEKTPENNGSSNASLLAFLNRDNLPMATANLTETPPVIDGKLNDKCWKNATVLTPFLTLQGELNTHQQTEVMTAYDQNNIYLAFTCHDSFLHPLRNMLHMFEAKIKTRDGKVIKDESVEIFIVPEKSRPQNYYQIGINIDGVVWDKGPKLGNSWNSGIKTGTFRNEKAWCLEIMLPLKDLNVKNLETGDSWRVNFCRNRGDGKPRESTAWAPTFGSFHNYKKFGILNFGENAPVIRSANIPKELREGTNTIELGILSQNKTELLVRNKVIYAEADKTANQNRLKIHPGKINKVKDDFIVFTEEPSRKNSEKCGVIYQLVNSENRETYYSSPGIFYSCEKSSPFKTSLISHLSGVSTVKTDKIYIANHSSLFRNILIQYADNIKGKYKECEFILDVPEYIKILAYVSEGRFKVKSQPIKEITPQKDKGKRRIFRVTIPADEYTYRQEEISTKHKYTMRVNLLLLCDNSKSGTRKDIIRFHSQAIIAGKTTKGASVSLPLEVLPAINGKRPAKYPIISSLSSYSHWILGTNTPEEQEALFKNIEQAGCNVFSVNAGLFNVDNNSFVKEIRNRGLKLQKGFFPLRNGWTHLLPDAREYLKKYPQHAMVRYDGKKINNEVSFTHLFDNKNNKEYMDMVEKHISKIAKSCDWVIYDVEKSTVGKNSYGYSEEDLESFRKFAGISKKVTGKDVQSAQYVKKWKDFQCRQWAKRVELVSRIVKKANPNCVFDVYSGYQSDPPHYCINWRYVKPYIDYAECGYGRNPGAVKATIKAIAPKKLITGARFRCFLGNYGSDLTGVRNVLFQRITDGNGGLFLFYVPLVDGRFWKALGDTSKLISDYEPFFLNHTRDESLVKIISGFTKDDLAVLRNAKAERLIFLFNNGGKPKEFKFKNLKRIPGAKLIDYYAEKDLGNLETVAIEIKPNSARVLIYGIERNK